MSIQLTGMLACACLGSALGLVVYLGALAQQRPATLLGHRGLQRQRAQAGSFAWRMIDALLRPLTPWLARLRLPRLRARLALELGQSGDYLGLDPDELLALSLLAGALGGVLTAYASVRAGFGLVGVVPGALLGGSTPWSRMRARTAARKRQLNHTLPPTIDLLSLCMSAGLDFGSALELVAAERAPESAVLQAEIRRVLHGLRTGQTRKQALLELGARTQTGCVQDFVNAVVQADEKGTPLATVLEIQARMLRLRRGVLAEEAAARAAVMLVLPLLLLLASILCVMLGPFMVKGIGL